MTHYIEAIISLESDKNLLSYLLPYVDAILFENKDLCLDVVKDKNGSKFLALLNRILVS